MMMTMNLSCHHGKLNVFYSYDVKLWRWVHELNVVAIIFSSAGAYVAAIAVMRELQIRLDFIRRNTVDLS